MSRVASELTLAIRNLYDTHGNVTYINARPMLKAAGHKLAPEPGEKSANYKLFEPELEGFTTPDGDEQFQNLFNQINKKIKLSGPDLAKVMNEHKVHIAFNKERRNYDVVKSNYVQSKKTSPVSKKPAASGNTKAHAAASIQKRRNLTPVAKVAPVAAVAMTGIEEAMQFVEANGKVKGVNKLLQTKRNEVAELRRQAEALDAEITGIEGMLAQIEAFESRLRKVA